MRRVFVSASVPDPRRKGEEHYAETADNVAIRDAITALVEVVTPTATLVFGGHPAITPMVARVAGTLATLNSVEIFQSRWFEPFFPPENHAFQTLVQTPRRETRAESLKVMREKMLAGPFDAAVFIGGMKGVEDEYEAVHNRVPICLPVATTGGAALVIAERERIREKGLGELFKNYNYVPLFRRLLGLTTAR